MNATTQTDVLVVGAGPAGLATALALAENGIEVVIAAPAYDADRAGADRRTTALMASSVDFLKNLGVWSFCANQSAPLEGIRLVDARGGLLRAPEVLFDAGELGVSSFGANITNAALMAALVEQAHHRPRLTWRPTSGVGRIRPTQSMVSAEFTEGGTLTARLVVAADGRNSIARAGAGIAVRTWAYPQAALAGDFQHSLPHSGISTELHRRAGPLTTVPLPGTRSSLVWVEAPAEAAQLAGLDDAGFLMQLEARLQGLLGSLGEIGPRAHYPLSGMSAQRMGQKRVALVGEAAHVIPPIGAQGLNLGLRDGAALADCVADAHARGGDSGDERTLAAYGAARTADVMTRSVAVDLLNRSLLTNFLPVQAFRGLGLHLLANVSPLRRLAMQGGLAPAGPLPRLMRAGALP